MARAESRRPRPAACVTSRSRAASSAVSSPPRNRHFHAPAAVPGMFMRASEPSPRTSWVWTIATRAREENA